MLWSLWKLRRNWDQNWRWDTKHWALIGGESCHVTECWLLIGWNAGREMSRCYPMLEHYSTVAHHTFQTSTINVLKIILGMDEYQLRLMANSNDDFLSDFLNSEIMMTSNNIEGKLNHWTYVDFFLHFM